MSREFTLVLLGSGILTAGYFLAPDPNEGLQKEADQQAANRVGGSTYRSHFFPLVWAHSVGYSGNNAGRPVGSTAGVTRGGIGGIGRSATIGS